MSERTALYRLFDAKNELLYVGIAKSFGVRWDQHAKVQPWWPDVHHQAVEWLPDRDAAFRAETEAIRQEHPRYNIMHNRQRQQNARTGLPDEQEPLLVYIHDARVEYDRARAELMDEIREAFKEARTLPPGRKRELGPSAIARASGFTREYVAQLRDGKLFPG